MPIAFVFFLLANTLPILGASDIPTTLTASSLTLTVEPAIARPFNEVSVADIANHKIRLIGVLGKAIGTRVQARFIFPQQPYAHYYISITELDGVKLDHPIMLPVEDQQREPEGYKKIPVTNKKLEYLAVGYEIAEYISYPSWIWKDSDITPHPTESDQPSMAFQFLPHFVVVKVLEAKEVPSQ